MKYNGLKRNKSNRNALFFGIIITTASFFGITFLTSLILSLLKNPLGASGLSSFAVLLLTGMISGFFTSKYKGEGGILLSGAIAVIFALVLLGAGLISSDGKLASITFVNLSSYVALTFVFAAMARSKKKRRRTR